MLLLEKGTICVRPANSPKLVKCFYLHPGSAQINAKKVASNMTTFFHSVYYFSFLRIFLA